MRRLIVFGERPNEPDIATPRDQGTLDSVLVTLGCVLASALLPVLMSQSNNYWMRATYALALVFVVVFLASFVTSRGYYVPGRVRIAWGERALRFAAARREVVFSLLLTSVVVAWGVVSIREVLIHAGPLGRGVAPLESPLRVYAVSIGSLVVVWLLLRTVVQLIRQAPGVTIDHREVTLAWAGKVERVVWADLQSAELQTRPRTGHLLTIQGKSGAVVASIRPRGCGSDPAIVAAAINYFRDHPADRGQLSQPELAWERFRASFAQGTGDVQP